MAGEQSALLRFRAARDHDGTRGSVATLTRPLDAHHLLASAALLCVNYSSIKNNKRSVYFFFSYANQLRIHVALSAQINHNLVSVAVSFLSLLTT